MSRRERDPRFEPSGFVVVRTPLLPFDELEAWSDGLRAPGCLDHPEALEAALAADRDRLRARLGARLDDPLLREALFLASPRVSETVERWRKDPDGHAAASGGIEPVVVSYLARACSRSTPFGLWAGWSTGAVGERTALRLGGRHRYRRHTRIDREYLSALADALARHARYRRALTYRPNTSLYELAGGLRFAFARPTPTGRAHDLVAVAPSPPVTATLRRAGEGATWPALLAALAGDGYTPADAEDFLAELVDHQLLVPDVTPAVTGTEPGPAMVAALAARAETAGPAERLGTGQDALGAIDAAGLGVPTDRYLAVVASLEGLPATPDPARLVEVDLRKPADLVVPPGVVAEIARGVRILWRLQVPAPLEALSRFREDFERRYGSRAVPLCEALDEESGVGFSAPGRPGVGASPLLGPLPFPNAPGERGEVEDWTGRDAVLVELLSQAWSEGATEIHLSAGDLRRLAAADPDPLPDAWHALATVAAASEGAVAAGDFRVYLDHAQGPSGARLLGRSCHADPLLGRLVRGHLEAEAALRPDAVFAEIVHQPDGRAGCLRPVLRSHEITYLGRSGAPPERQSAVTDLDVTLDGHRVVLWSRQLGREVIPRLTSAHNYPVRSLPLYRFLGSLGDQGVASRLAWEWGPLADAPFLPRVTCGRVVLARARWNLTDDERRLLAGDGSGAHFGAVQEWRRRQRVPRYVLLADDDREILGDLDNILSVEALARQLARQRRRQAGSALVELFPGPDELCVTGPEGRFVHEMVVPFVRAPAPAPPPRRRTRARPVTPGRRRFPPGSEWLYAKLYTGEASADRVLTDAVAPLVRGWLASGAADGWFFVREADPDPHLRLRVHGPARRLHAEVLPALTATAASLVDAGQMWRVAFDTYEREIERYGGERGVELVERIFAVDSDAVLDILAGLASEASGVAGDAAHDARWRLALCGVDRLLGDLGLDLDGKRAVARAGRHAYEAEFGTSSAFRSAIGRRLRRERGVLDALLAGTGIPAALVRGVGILGRRSERLAPLVAELHHLAGIGSLTVTIPEVARPLAHMHAGRMFRPPLRPQEYVLYELLDRLYTARAARRAPSLSPSPSTP